MARQPAPKKIKLEDGAAIVKTEENESPDYHAALSPPDDTVNETTNNNTLYQQQRALKMTQPLPSTSNDAHVSANPLTSTETENKNKNTLSEVEEGPLSIKNNSERYVNGQCTSPDLNPTESESTEVRTDDEEAEDEGETPCDSDAAICMNSDINTERSYQSEESENRRTQHQAEETLDNYIDGDDDATHCESMHHLEQNTNIGVLIEEIPSNSDLNVAQSDLRQQPDEPLRPEESSVEVNSQQCINSVQAPRDPVGARLDKIVVDQVPSNNHILPNHFSMEKEDQAPTDHDEIMQNQNESYKSLPEGVNGDNHPNQIPRQLNIKAEPLDSHIVNNTSKNCPDHGASSVVSKSVQNNDNQFSPTQNNVSQQVYTQARSLLDDTFETEEQNANVKRSKGGIIDNNIAEQSSSTVIQPTKNIENGPPKSNTNCNNSDESCAPQLKNVKPDPDGDMAVNNNRPTHTETFELTARNLQTDGTHQASATSAVTEESSFTEAGQGHDEDINRMTSTNIQEVAHENKMNVQNEPENTQTQSVSVKHEEQGINVDEPSVSNNELRNIQVQLKNVKEEDPPIFEMMQSNNSHNSETNHNESQSIAADGSSENNVQLQLKDGEDETKNQNVCLVKVEERTMQATAKSNSADESSATQNVLTLNIEGVCRLFVYINGVSDQVKMITFPNENGKEKLRLVVDQSSNVPVSIVHGKECSALDNNTENNDDTKISSSAGIETETEAHRNLKRKRRLVASSTDEGNKNESALDSSTSILSRYKKRATHGKKNQQNNNSHLKFSKSNDVDHGFDIEDDEEQTIGEETTITAQRDRELHRNETSTSSAKRTQQYKNKLAYNGRTVGVDGHMAFCCSACTCSAEMKRRSGNVKINCGNSNAGNKFLFHNFCCHGIPAKEKSADWISPIQEANEKASAMFLAPDSDPDENNGEGRSNRDSNETSGEDARNRFNAIVQKEELFKQMNLNDEDLTSTSKKYDYSEFRHMKKTRNKLDPLVVLYMFSGIGSGIVALKRLGVAIKTVICVDDDPVASHVRKYNHDRTYHNQAPSDHIEYNDNYNTLEELKKDIRNVLLKHGPIDLVLGGSTTAHEGRCIKAFRELVIDIRNHSLQKDKPLFFLSESNLAIHKKLNVKTIQRAFGKANPPIQVNSGRYSPCEKMRTYWLNLPFDEYDDSISMKGRYSEPNLDDGFYLPEFYLKKKSFSAAKAKSFEVLDQVDSDRMMKLKEVDKENENQKMYQMKTFSIAERERMLGLNRGYVEGAVEDLYKNLKKSFDCEIVGGTWYGDLDPKYYGFAKCKFNFVPVTDFERFLYDIEIRLPSTASTSVYNKKNGHQQGIYCDKDKYSKHLLGNAYSIAVAEVLLSPLKDICTLRQYEGYNYDFSWIEDDDDDDDDDQILQV